MKTLRFVFLPILTATLVACAPPRPVSGSSTSLPRSTQPSMQDRFADLRAKSIAVVDGYSVDVAAFLKKRSKSAAISAAKKNVADSLKDPSSAQFRNVRLVPYKDGSVICGEVNAKNSYGGYVGFKDFVASTTSATLQYEDAKYPAIAVAANAGLATACN